MWVLQLWLCVNTDGFLLQVVMLQDKLEVKDQEIQRLKHELQRKSSIEDDKTVAPSEKDSGKKMSDEAVN